MKWNARYWATVLQLAMEQQDDQLKARATSELEESINNQEEGD